MSTLALNLIENAKKNNSKTLNLGMCGLTEIPEEVFELTELEELYLCNRYWDYEQEEWVDSNNNGLPNKIKSITEGIIALKKLFTLFAGGDYKYGSWAIQGLNHLSGLENLQTLSLSYNNISDISFLKSLTGLTSLDLSYNNISDISILESLTGLILLDLSYNNISDISILQSLTGLNTLDLRDNQIPDISFLQSLTGLTSLYLSSNKQITDFSILGSLTGLSTLYLRSNELTDVSFLGSLTGLSTLDLRSNVLTDVSVLSSLTRLSTLTLVANNISDLSFLQFLTGLNTLNLGYNNISDLSVLQSLTGLSTLNLSNNNISDLSVLESLIGLTSLDLSYNNISDLSVLESLIGLTSLDLTHDKQITDFSILGSLTGLSTLYLSSNELTDVSFLGSLTGLSTLDLRSNKITDIEPLLGLIKKGIAVKWKRDILRLEFGIYTENNPWSVPPAEIVKQGNEAILEYFAALKDQDQDYLYEAKMLIVGEGGVGKTSLAIKLLDENETLPAEEETTKGIDIQPLTFSLENGQKFTINIWDFGGQEIYHATHQMFLTKRSLYILVDDTRKDDKNVHDASFRYWLQTVELFGGNSPLLIVQNEKGDRSKDIDLKSMRGQFGFIQDKYPVNLLTSRGVEAVKKDIMHLVQKLPHIGQTLPKQWVKIREELLKLAEAKPYISLEKYLEICADHTIADKKQALILSQYLHDLGTFLHFQNDDLLRRTIILENEWATDAVYRVLDDEAIKANKGRFTKKEAQGIWTESTYQDMAPELLALMLKFELCYEFENQKDTYLIPQLLPASQPNEFSWDNNDNLQLRYQYGFMPKGLLSRFMVRAHIYLKDFQKNSWKNGVVLEKDNTYAFVSETFAKNEIAIRVRGVHQKSLMTIVAEKIDELNSSFEGIKVDKLIPCNCSTCLKLEEPHFFEFENINSRIENKKGTIECKNAPYEDVPILGLVDNLFERIRLSSIEENSAGYRNGPNQVINIHGGVAHFSKKGSHHSGSGDNKQSPENADDSEKIKTITPVKWYESWWFQRIAGAFFAGLFGALGIWFFTDWHPFSGFYIVFGVVAVILLSRGNPDRRFYRAARYSLWSALALLALQLGVSLELTQKLENGNFKLAIEWLSEYDWLIAILLILLSGFLYYLDWKRDKKQSRNKNNPPPPLQNYS